MDANPDKQKTSFLAQLQLAIAFLTRVPTQALVITHDDSTDEVSPDHASGPGALADAMWLFPLVGFGVGGVGAIVLGILIWLDVPAPVAATLAVGTMIWLTGALHEDGLADIADGFGGGKDKGSKLHIMRDSRVGTYGIVTIAIVLIAKVAALAALAEWNPGAAVAALIAAATWSRAMFAPTMRWLEPARENGLGADAGTPKEGTSWLGLALAAALSLLVLLSPAGFGTIIILAAGGLAAFMVGWIALKQIGGYTGDVLGAAQQIGEAATLVAASAIISGTFT
ncbi:MAG: adenosylcobinamide-GDP ribazoletransferase [Alphaproteobacteria bacterium]|jgi:adenosylcobinamide-GDP ribazoletransferase|nr:adenosylcobinamide-GDP ribazoletransferase [Alphaproteobacteria bacterium]